MPGLGAVSEIIVQIKLRLSQLDFWRRTRRRSLNTGTARPTTDAEPAFPPKHTPRTPINRSKNFLCPCKSNITYNEIVDHSLGEHVGAVNKLRHLRIGEGSSPRHASTFSVSSVTKIVREVAHFLFSTCLRHFHFLKVTVLRFAIIVPQSGSSKAFHEHPRRWGKSAEKRIFISSGGPQSGLV